MIKRRTYKAGMEYRHRRKHTDIGHSIQEVNTMFWSVAHHSGWEHNIQEECTAFMRGAQLAGGEWQPILKGTLAFRGYTVFRRGAQCSGGGTVFRRCT